MTNNFDQPRRFRLGREIAITLAIKLILLYGLWSAFFSQPVIHGMTQGMDPDRVESSILRRPVADGTTKQ